MQNRQNPGRRPVPPASRDRKNEYASPSGNRGRYANARPGTPQNIKQNPNKRPSSNASRMNSRSVPNRPKPHSPGRMTRREYDRMVYEREMRKIREQRKRESKQKRQVFYSKAIICLVIFAILAVMLTVFLSIGFFSSTDKIAGSSITYKYGGKEICSAPSETVAVNGTILVDFSDVADYLSLSRIGDESVIKYIFTSHNNSFISFSASSRYAVVNGINILLDETPVSYRKSLWVPLSFIQNNIVGISAEYENSTVSISRIVDENADNDNGIVFVEVFPIPETSNTLSYGEETASGKLSFKADLTEYSQYMNPDKAEDYLTIISREKTADAPSVPGDLVNVENTRQDGRDMQKLRIYAAKSLEALFLEMEADGIYDMSVTSGYVSYDEQAELFAASVEYEMAMNPYLSEEEANEKAHEGTEMPGESEHQTGLCVDMHNMLTDEDADFAETDAFYWLRRNAWKFGYILRYPEGKSDITGHEFEPWHWRYVGRNNARKIYDGAMTLEEFVNSTIEN